MWRPGSELRVCWMLWGSLFPDPGAFVQVPVCMRASPFPCLQQPSALLPILRL